MELGEEPKVKETWMKKILGYAYYSMAETAKKLGITYGCLYKKVRNNEISFVRFNNVGPYHFSGEYLKAYLAGSVHQNVEKKESKKK